MSKATPQDYKLLFEDHKIGQLVLEDLVVRFSRPPVLEGGIDAVLKTYDRGGMRKVVDHIVTQINRANGVEDPNADEVQSQE